MADVRRQLLLATVAAVLLAGCSSTPSRPTATAPATSADRSSPPSSAVAGVADTQTLSCAHPIDGGPPPADYEVVLGAVALPTSSVSRAIGAADSGGGATRLFAKAGLLVRAGQAVELQVGAPTGNRLGIGWGGWPSQPSRRFVVPPCPDGKGTGWLVFAGGYWIDQPLCLPVTVRVADMVQRVTIGVGTACPGQRPPAGPGA